MFFIILSVNMKNTSHLTNLTSFLQKLCFYFKYVLKLQHCVASNLLNDGFTTVQVAEWLGHSSSTTTLKFYAHIDKTSKLAIANSLQAD